MHEARLTEIRGNMNIDFDFGCYDIMTVSVNSFVKSLNVPFKFIQSLSFELHHRQRERFNRCCSRAIMSRVIANNEVGCK